MFGGNLEGGGTYKKNRKQKRFTENAADGTERNLPKMPQRKPEPAGSPPSLNENRRLQEHQQTAARAPAQKREGEGGRYGHEANRYPVRRRRPKARPCAMREKPRRANTLLTNHPQACDLEPKSDPMPRLQCIRGNCPRRNCPTHRLRHRSLESARFSRREHGTLRLSSSHRAW